MKIIFPYIPGKINGPEKWRIELSSALTNKGNTVICVPVNIKGFILNIKNIFQCDIVHSYNQAPVSILICLIAKLTGKKIIHTVHGNFYSEQFNKKGLRKIFWLPFNKICLLLADRITFPSQFTLKSILKCNPKLKSKSIVILNGINIEKIKNIKPHTKTQLGLQEKTFLIIEVTNFNHIQKVKGIDLLIQAYKKFRNNIQPNSTLIIIGSGKNYKNYCNKYKSTNIKFLGYRKDAISIMKTCDLFVHSSLLDNFPYVILEAMACGKPIITVDIGGIPEALGNAGIIVDPHEKKILRAMKEVYKNKGFRKQLSQRTFKRVKLYDWSVVSKRFWKIYKKVLNNE